MKWNVVLWKNDYALLQNERDTQYVVAHNYNPYEKEDQQWDSGTYFAYWGTNEKPCMLSAALELFRTRTETNYVSKDRLEELATLFKDGLLEDDRESALEYFNETCEMEDYEKEFFGIEMEDDEDE